MDRMSQRLGPIEDERSTRMFQRTLALWAGDLLRQPPSIQWPAQQPAIDFRNHDWKSLYQGSVLDD